jgi:hypothetical protein
MMAGMITLILIGLLRGIRTHRALVLENLALRHQLAVLRTRVDRSNHSPGGTEFWRSTPPGVPLAGRESTPSTKSDEVLAKDKDLGRKHRIPV